MTAPKLSPNGVRRRGAPSSSASTVPFLPLVAFVATLIVALILFYNPSSSPRPPADPHETMKTTLSSAARHPGLTNKSSSSSLGGSSAGAGGASSPSSSTTAAVGKDAAKGGGTTPMSPPGGVAQDHHSKEQALANLRQLEFETILSPIVVVPPDYIPPVPYRRDALTLLHDLSTPHGRAFDFVVRRDQRKIALDDVVNGDGMVGDVTERRKKERQIVQRFVVSLLFYSTGGADGDGNDEPRSSTWTHGAAHFLSPLHECHWSKSLPYSDLLYGIVKHRSHKVGVTSCHSQSLTVTEIRLNDNGLTGTLPAELRELTELEVLDVRGNRLSGPIPKEWGLLGQGIGDEGGWADSMKYLGLDGNGLTGEVPSELGSLTNLEHLYLNFNDFSGAIPSEVCRLRDDANVDPIDDDDNLNLLRRRRRRLRQGQRGTDAAAGSSSRRRAATERRRTEGRILNGKLTDLWSDCGAAWPPLECACCTVCCDGMGECDEVGDDGSVGMTEEDDDGVGLDDDGFEDDDFQGERGGVDDGDDDKDEGFDDDDEEEGEERP